MRPEAAPEQELEVVVDRVVFDGGETGFRVIRVVPEGAGQTCMAAGRFFLEPVAGEPLTLRGRFEEHPRHGPQFKVRSARPRIPATAEGIRRYLASGRIKGVGPKLAGRMVDHFGPSTLEVLEEHPERLLEIPGIGRGRLEELVRALRAGRDAQDTIVFLQGLGLGPALSEQVWQRLGHDTMARIKSDPYTLVSEVRGVGFGTADRMAGSLGIDGEAPQRIEAGLAHVLRDAVTEGHLCLEAPELIERTARLLELDADVVGRGVQTALDAGILRAVRPAQEALAPSPRIYLPFLLAAEEEVARRLTQLSRAPRPPAVPAGDAALATGSATAEQRAAVDLLLSAKVALLTGGPGVGKTTVLRMVVSAYEGAGLRVALASPTGRAARRLAESTGREAATLHRWFGLRPGMPAGPGKPLDAEVLVIDETSMLDLPLLLQVLRRLDETAIVILVGDPDQLPSVGPGRVLGDLLESEQFPTARLSTVFRQKEGGLIVGNAHRILRGEAPEVPPSGATSDFFFVQRREPSAGADLIRELVVERIPARFGIDPTKGIQVLSPMHRGATGVNALNGMLQQALNSGRPAVSHRGRRFHEGDRVMQVRNDHEREIMNGDLGVVMRVDRATSKLVARFDGIEREYGEAALDDLELAFAVTVHKSQGGEFPAVVLPLYSEHFLMLRRNVLYTAVTRARRLLVIVGTRDALGMAVRDDRRVRRRGELLTRLRGEAMVTVPRL